MLKRIAIFIAAHLAFLGVAVALVVASTANADAQTDNPYMIAFVAPGETALRGGPEADSAVIGTLAAGTSDIRLRWCRPEFAIEHWMFGSSRRQQQLLNERVCEVQAAVRVGFVDGSALRVQ